MQENNSSISLIDAGELRSDLTSRREVKYAIERVDVGKLRRLLEVNCRRLVHNEPVSQVRSIYFDDARLSACRANMDGLSLRRKLRLRWYDSPKPECSFFLEIKWRDNRVTGKHRMEMQTGQPVYSLTYRQLFDQLARVIPDHLARDLFVFDQPIMIIQYNREHFATDDGLRITLDYDLTYFDQTGRSTISTDFPRQMESLVVLEGKTPVGRESELRQWLHPLAPRATRCSKYVHGCCQLGLIHESVL